MVYCGKPSKGCQMCRTRRIKCDETKPTCMQCQKSRRQCPGYKDDFDLVFRNETQATERRARKTSKKLTTTIVLPDNSSSFPVISREDLDMMETSDSRNAMMMATSNALAIPVEQQAPCFFLQNYTLPPSDGGRGYFDFLAPLMRSEGPDSQLSVAFSAVSMASLANRPNTKGRDAGLMSKAVGLYAKALKATNLALQNPVQQKTDQTLAAILMLGFFETVASERSNAAAWYSHVDGAVQLVRMRGKKQLRTKVGQALFYVVRAQMTINCMTASKVPVGGADWWCSDSPSTDISVFIVRLNIRVAELRAEITTALTHFPRTPEYFQKVTDLIRRAHSMEKEYQEWEQKLPSYLKAKTVAWVDNTGGDITKAEVCPGKVDVYYDIRVATLWNNARILRLYVSGVIVRCAAWICSPVDYRTTPEYSSASRLCLDLVTDIIASTPFLLGWRHGTQDGGMRTEDLPHFTASLGNFGSRSGVGGFFAMWPLFSVSNTDFITDSQRAWVKGRLIFISEIMGLNHAKVLSTMQLRLPSMIIRRDNMNHTPPTPQMMAAAVYAARSPSPLTPQTPQGQMQVQGHGQGQQLYALNPLQQREAMQREAYEKERASLLKKATNSQGDAVEQVLAKYLSV